MCLPAEWDTHILFSCLGVRLVLSTEEKNLAKFANFTVDQMMTTHILFHLQVF